MFPIPNPDFANGLSIIESYQYFDRPVLFSCKDQVGEIYLSVWVAHDENTEEETWLFTPIHWGIWQATRSGGLDLHDAFRSSKSGKVHVVTVDWNSNSANSKSMSSHDLDDDWLPAIGERLDLVKDSTLLPLSKVSGKLNKVVQDIILQPQNDDDGLSVRVTNRILNNFQMMVEALLFEKQMQTTKPRMRVPIAIKKQSQMNLLATFPGSLGMRLISVSSGIFDNQLVTDVVESFSKIINLSKNTDDLKEELAQSSGRFLVYYVDFLKQLITGKTVLSLNWSSVSESKEGNAQISWQNASEVVGLVKGLAETSWDDFQVVGELVRGDIENGKFKLHDSSNNGNYSGKIDDKAKDVPLTLGKMYEASLRAKIQINSLTQEEKINYRLMELKPI